MHSRSVRSFLKPNFGRNFLHTYTHYPLTTQSLLGLQVFRVNSINGQERKFANPDTDDREQVAAHCTRPRDCERSAGQLETNQKWCEWARSCKGCREAHLLLFQGSALSPQQDGSQNVPQARGPERLLSTLHSLFIHDSLTTGYQCPLKNWSESKRSRSIGHGTCGGGR